MGRSPCCFREGLNRGAWTPLEDKILKDYITSNGEGEWRSLPKRAGLKRCGKSCRLRWLNYLRPGIKRGNITPDEEELIIRLHNLLGNRWALIAGRLPGRTDNEIKNYWNTHICRRIQAIKSTTTESRAKTKNPLSATKQPKQHLLQHEGSSVFRTKASRCSKVFTNSDLQQHDQQRQIDDIVAKHKTIEAKISENSDIQPIVTNDHNLSSENSAKDDFLVDDIDFANLLDKDFFTPPPPAATPQPRIDHTSNINEIDVNISFSLNPCDLLFGSRHGHEAHDEFNGVDFDTINMLSIFDNCTTSTLDWIQEQPST